MLDCGRSLYENSALSIAKDVKGALNPVSAVNLSVQLATFV
jgi:hypothetical protein